MRFPSSKVRKKNEITMEINKKNEEKNNTFVLGIILNG